MHRFLALSNRAQLLVVALGATVIGLLLLPLGFGFGVSAALASMGTRISLERDPGLLVGLLATLAAVFVGLGLESVIGALAIGVGVLSAIGLTMLGAKARA